MIQPDYDNMTYRRCGNSGVHLPAVSLGLWHNFGRDDDQGNARDLILKSFEAGVTHFDLANNYGPPPGSAEETFGRVFAQDLSSHRHELFLATKAGYEMWDGPYGSMGSRKHLLDSLDQSLERMGVDYVDVFYSHRYDKETPLEETMSALATAVQSGKARYVGVSNYRAEYNREAIRLLKQWQIPCLIHQFKYNIFTRVHEKELLPFLNESGVGGIVYSPLSQGLLTGRYLDGIPEDSRMARAHFLKEKSLDAATVVAIEALNGLAQRCEMSLAQFALLWVFHRPEVTSVLVGVSRAQQLYDNLDAIRKPALTEDVLTEVDRICEERDQALAAT